MPGLSIGPGLQIASGGTPGGTTLQIQYNNNGAFGGVPSSSWDGTRLFMPTMLVTNVGINYHNNAVTSFNYEFPSGSVDTITAVLTSTATPGLVTLGSTSGAVDGTLNTAKYQSGGLQVVGPRITGYGTPTGGAKLANFPGATATLAQTSGALAQLLLDLETHGLLGV